MYSVTEINESVAVGLIWSNTLGIINGNFEISQST